MRLKAALMFGAVGSGVVAIVAVLIGFLTHQPILLGLAIAATCLEWLLIGAMWTEP